MDHTIKCGHCHDTHTTADEVRYCWVEQEDFEMMNRDEIRAEAISSWITSGGNPDDASTYASGVLAGRY